MRVITLTALEETSSLAPWQVSGTTDEGQDFYARSRHGGWRIELDGEVIADGAGHVYDMHTLCEMSGIDISVPE